MPRKSKPAVPRAPRGSIADSILVRLDADLSKAIRAAAEREGVSVGEWMRRAAKDRVARQEWITFPSGAKMATGPVDDPIRGPKGGR